jgi:hypothetical protein
MLRDDFVGSLSANAAQADDLIQDGGGNEPIALDCLASLS